jgi:enoyl reductase-like protein
MKMNSKKWVDLTDNEKDNFSLDDAWRAGAAEMIERLFDFTKLDEDIKKRLIEEEVDKLKEGRE